MKKPVDEVEKEFNKGGIYFLEAKSIGDSLFEGNYISIRVQIDVMNTSAITAPEFSNSVFNKRGVALYVTDWSFTQHEGYGTLSFLVSQRLPEGAQIPAYDVKYMSFLDLCWYAGNEQIPEVYGDDIITKPVGGFSAADLGWTLPSRFVDSLIDALGKIDDSLLGGNMSQALLYGPLFTVK